MGRPIFSRLKSIAVVNLLLLMFNSVVFAADKLPYIKTLVPHNQKGIEKLWSNFEDSFKNDLDKFLDDLNDRNGAEAVHIWGKMIKDTQVARTQLGYLIPTELYPATDLAKTAKDHFDQINALYEKTVNSADFQNQIATFIFGVNDLLPHEVQFFRDFLSRFNVQGNAEQIHQALQKLQHFPSTPYNYLEGTGERKGVVEEVTVFNANLLFMPEDFTYYFGGVAPWEARINQIAHHLIKKNCDILCLQEIHDEESAFALYRKLKHMYPYFYINIGADIAIVDPDMISMNSGLFVASKYKIENPQFERFSVQGMQKGIHKGFFSGVVLVGDKPFCFLINTHLNPFDSSEAEEVRKVETQTIVQAIQHLQVKHSIPALVVGDLNIPYGSVEWGRSLFNRSFINTFGSKHHTCTDYFNDLVWTEPKSRDQISPNNYIYDYALIYQAYPMKIESHMVPFYHLNHPLDALSDHQGIKSVISLVK